MIELDDCGKEVLLSYDPPLTFPYGADRSQTETKIQMVIKAPRGTLTLFDRNYISPDTQCEAIKAFMEEHNDTKETTKKDSKSTG